MNGGSEDRPGPFGLAGGRPLKQPQVGDHVTEMRDHL